MEPGDPPPEKLLPHKAHLISRGIKPFNESNWWHWGRLYPLTDAPRVYVNAKTRNERLFFRHHGPHFDGAALAIFPRDRDVDLGALCEALNDLDWSSLGFVCDNRFQFSQRSLENAPLPDGFARFMPGR